MRRTGGEAGRHYSGPMASSEILAVGAAELSAVLLLLVVVVIPIATVAFARSGKAYSEIGKGRFAVDFDEESETSQQEEIRHQLASNLQAVVSQRLVQKAGGSGRVPAVEILINTPTIKEMLVEGRPLNTVRALIEEGVTQYGMQSFDQSLMKLLREGHVSETEALKHCTNPNEFELHLKGISATSNRTWQAVEQGTLPGATKPSTYGQPGNPEAGDPRSAPLGSVKGVLPSWMSKE